MEYIVRALCGIILPRFDDFSRDYKSVSGYAQCPNFEHVLAKTFNVELECISQCLECLRDFKNVNGDMQSCIASARNLSPNPSPHTTTPSSSLLTTRYEC